MRLTAFARSSGVRNQAFVGESGNKNLYKFQVRGAAPYTLHSTHQ